MISHVWTVLCLRALIDERTKNVTLVNAVERLSVAEEPATGVPVPVALEVVSLWARETPGVPAVGQARLRLCSPSGDEISSNDVRIDLTNHERLRTIRGVRGLPFSGLGRYYFRVDLQSTDEEEWHEVAAVPLTVELRPPDQPSDAA